METPPTARLTGGNPGLAPTRLEEGEVLGRFVVVKALGSGSGGVVYGAWDSHLGRRVALKVFEARGGDSDRGWRRLIHEAQLIARLDHPNVVTVHDVGALDDRAFIAMELVDGHDLAHVIAETNRDVPWRERVAPLLLAGDGLAAAHAARVIHGDFKPANVLVGNDGRVKVSDFGIGHLHEAEPDTASLGATGDHDTASAEVTADGRLWGTPLYMAPELFQGQRPTRASDVYSFCASLYHAVYRQPPAQGEGLMALFSAKLDPRPGTDEGCVPWRLRDLIMRGLDPDPSRRPASVARVVSALRKLGRRRSRRSMIAGGVIAAAGVATAGWAIGESDAVCTEVDTELANAWNDGRRGDVSAAFEALELPRAAANVERIHKSLDSYANAWSDARLQTCKLTQRGEQSTLLEDRKMACLDQRLSELDAFVKVLVRADRKVARRASSSADNLTSIAGCLDRDTYLDVPLPADAPVVDDVRSRLARARGLRVAGRPAEASPLIDEALIDAKAVDYPPLQAEALRQHGLALRDRGHYDAAEKALTEAVWTAEGAKADVVAAKASLDVLRLLGNGLARPKEALAWAPHVHVAIRRAELGPDEQARFLLARGQAHVDLFQHEEAIRDFDDAEAMIDAVVTRPEVLRGALGTARALLHQMRGEYGAAAEEFDGVVEIYERAFGRRHAEVARALDNAANTYRSTHEPEKALALEDESLSIAKETLGPRHPTTLSIASNRAGVLVELGRYDDAIDDYHEVLEAQTHELGKDHPQYAASLLNLAGVLGMAERFDESAEAATKGRVALEERFGSEHPWVGFGLINEGSARLERGEIDLALALLERAHTLLSGATVEPDKLASAKFALGKALARAGVERSRALDLMQASLKIFEEQKLERSDIREAIAELER